MKNLFKYFYYCCSFASGDSPANIDSTTRFISTASSDSSSQKHVNKGVNLDLCSHYMDEIAAKPPPVLKDTVHSVVSRSPESSAIILRRGSHICFWNLKWRETQEAEDGIKAAPCLDLHQTSMFRLLADVTTLLSVFMHVFVPARVCDTHPHGSETTEQICSSCSGDTGSQVEPGGSRRWPRAWFLASSCFCLWRYFGQFSFGLGMKTTSAHGQEA